MDYYGNEPSSDFFMHYGVKGMKWGVRRAKEKGNMSSLVNHYERALRKKASLKEQSNLKAEHNNAKEYAKAGGALLGTGALGGLASYGLAKGQIAAQQALFPNARYVTVAHPIGLYGMSGLAAAGGLASLGAAAKSAYHTTRKGHNKAVSRYKNFSKEMDKQFDKKTRQKINNYIREHPEYGEYINRNKKRG